MEARNEKKEKNPLKKWVIALAIIAVVFLGASVYFGIFNPALSPEYHRVAFEKEQLNSELETLMVSHEKIKNEYSEISGQLSEKDSIINANAEEIKQLIARQADYNKIRKQLARLQEIAKEYVQEIDQLYTENHKLKEENTQVKASLARAEQQNVEMQQNNEELSQRIVTASALNGYNFHARAVYYKNRSKEEVITEKASRVEKFKVSMILAENSLREPGEVNVYCRIAIPGSGKVLSPGASDAYSFENNGERLQYTAKKTVSYNNKAENVTLFWELKPGDKAVKGQYSVQFFTDEGYLGESFFTLR